MINYVIKRNGEKEKFDAEKLNKWAEFAAGVGVSWSEIAQQTFKRLNDPCTTMDIHETMIDVCLAKQDIKYSQVAARLELAGIRKGMKYILGIDDSAPFKEIFETLIAWGAWEDADLPDYNEKWEDVYRYLKSFKLEYWRIKQWTDKYAIKIDDIPVETPAIGYLGMSLALFGDTQEAYDYAEALIRGEVSLPTPALNGLRNGDWDTISCCVISANDTTDSIGVANWIAYRMTAKKAGIGIEYTTRSKGDSVKNGRVKHLGKWTLFKTIDREVKTLTQITRGGNATVTVLCIDPEIEDILTWRSQRIDIEQRIDKLDYSFGYNDAFLDAVVKDHDWYLFSLVDAPKLYDIFYKADTDTYNSYVESLIASGVKHKKIKARDLIKKFLTMRQETGRWYDINLTRTNTHTPFVDTIRQSNLCLEVALPTKGYVGMEDLYSNYSIGETAFCSLSAINVAKVTKARYERLAYLALKAVDIMIDRAPMMTRAMKNDIMRRRSVGIGIIGLANAMYRNGLDYDGSDESLEFVQSLAEHHYYYLLKASQRLAEEDGISVGGVDLNWLPIDTAINKPITDLDWEALRGKPRKHSVLVAHMPSESSALACGTTNGLYPARKKVINKRSRKGLVQFICEDFDENRNLTAWDVDNITLSKYYGRVQDYTDQAISCDFYFDPSKWENEKVPMSVLLKDWVAHAKLGNKTKYYLNTRDDNDGTYQDTAKNTLQIEEVEDGCGSGGCKL